MGHSAVVAIERSSGRYDLHRSPDGARSFLLASDISRATPFGGGRVEVERTPFATAVGTTHLLESHLDFLETEALYVVGTDRVRTYLPLWFGLDVAIERWPTVGFGAVVALREGREYREARRYRPWFEGVRATVATLCLDDGPDSEPVVTVGRRLERVLRRWLGDDREVRVAVPAAGSGVE